MGLILLGLSACVSRWRTPPGFFNQLKIDLLEDNNKYNNHGNSSDV